MLQGQRSTERSHDQERMSPTLGITCRITHASRMISNLLSTQHGALSTFPSLLKILVRDTKEGTHIFHDLRLILQSLQLCLYVPVQDTHSVRSCWQHIVMGN